MILVQMKYLSLTKAIYNMAERKRVKNEGFVGLQLTPELLKKLDAKVKETTLNRSQIIRMAIIEYLK